ncbi:MAG: glycosyltransferase family 4 protein, partial [Bacteroidota bacterium]
MGVHLLNDFSGSPLVFSNVINGLRAQGIDCDLHTCGGREGFLSGLDVRYQYFQYRFFPNPLLRLVALLWSQWLLFRNLRQYRGQRVLIYNNTLLPFGAALAGKWYGLPVVYHIHESSMKPALLKWFLKTIANRCSEQSIFVSNWLKETEQLPAVPASVVYNGLSQSFCRKADQYKAKRSSDRPFTCLLVGSLKVYKGVREMVHLAKAAPELHFEMVLNAQQEAIDAFFADMELPHNLNVHPTAKNIHPHYANADVVLNLSHPTGWVETFGMTLLEGMYYGLPCIAPPVGGPVEVVENELNGYHCDPHDIETLATKLRILATNPPIYQRFSQNAFDTS